MIVLQVHQQTQNSEKNNPKFIMLPYGQFMHAMHWVLLNVAWNRLLHFLHIEHHSKRHSTISEEPCFMRVKAIIRSRRRKLGKKLNVERWVFTPCLENTLYLVYEFFFFNFLKMIFIFNFCFFKIYLMFI